MDYSPLTSARYGVPVFSAVVVGLVIILEGA